MNWTFFIIFGVVIVPLIIMGVILLNGKGAFLIAGYNTMSQSEKSKYNEKALCRFMGWLMIAISFAMLLFPAGIYLEMTWLIYCAIAVILCGTAGAVIYTNTGQRFRNANAADINSELSADGKRFNKAVAIAVTAFLSIVLIAVGFLLYYGGKDIAVNIEDGRLEIKSMYGLNVKFSDITEITLIEKSMKDIGTGKRTDGYGGIGTALKGYFKSDHLGEIILFVQSGSSPTIRIERTNGKDIYISFNNSEKTKQIYYEITAGLQ